MIRPTSESHHGDHDARQPGAGRRPRSSTTRRIKAAIEYVLLRPDRAGLAIGMASWSSAALISDRLRRRDDIAAALGAPVRLSVGSPGSAPAGDPAGRRRQRPRLRRIAWPVSAQGYALRRSARAGQRLAVVAVDNAK